MIRRRVLYEEAMTSKTTGVYDADKPATVLEREREQRRMEEMASLRRKLIEAGKSDNGESVEGSCVISDTEVTQYAEVRRKTLAGIIDQQRALQELLTEEGVFLDSFIAYPSMRQELIQKRLARIAKELERLATVERIQNLNTEQLRKRKYLSEEKALWSTVAGVLCPAP